MSIETKSHDIINNNFINLKDKRLTKSEIREITSLSSSLNFEKLKLTLETKDQFNDFINTEYRWANESYLGGVAGVKKLQEYLIKEGFLASLKINGKYKEKDGIFGKKTFFALIAFQKSNGSLVIDGLAGPNTQRELFLGKTKKIANKNAGPREIKIEPFIDNVNNIFKSSSYVNRDQKEMLTNYFLVQNELYSSSSRLADFLKLSGYPRYRGGSSCGANVGEALNSFGIEGLPSYGRHGFVWKEILESHPDKFERIPISSPKDAKAGGILVYDKGYGATKDRKEYGHVEIALGNGKYWYGGPPKNKAGGSTKTGFNGYVYYPKNLA